MSGLRWTSARQRVSDHTNDRVGNPLVEDDVLDVDVGLVFLLCLNVKNLERPALFH